jgi:hypothetical protein
LRRYGPVSSFITKHASGEVALWQIFRRRTGLEIALSGRTSSYKQCKLAAVVAVLRELGIAEDVIKNNHNVYHILGAANQKMLA